MRTFVSINLTNEIKKELKDLQEQIKSKMTPREAGSMRWEQPDKFHITLFFIGDIDAGILNRVKNSLNAVNYDDGPLSLNLYSIGGFPNLRSPRVLFVNIKDDGKLVKLAEEVHLQMNELGYESDKKFHPHITLGRIKRDRKVNLTKLSEINVDIKFDANAFYLMESKLQPTGSVYTKRDRYELSLYKP